MRRAVRNKFNDSLCWRLFHSSFVIAQTFQCFKFGYFFVTTLYQSSFRSWILSTSPPLMTLSEDNQMFETSSPQNHFLCDYLLIWGVVRERHSSAKMIRIETQGPRQSQQPAGDTPFMNDNEDKRSDFKVPYLQVSWGVPLSSLLPWRG